MMNTRSRVRAQLADAWVFPSVLLDVILSYFQFSGLYILCQWRGVDDDPISRNNRVTAFQWDFFAPFLDDLTVVLPSSTFRMPDTTEKLYHSFFSPPTRDQRVFHVASNWLFQRNDVRPSLPITEGIYNWGFPVDNDRPLRTCVDGEFIWLVGCKNVWRARHCEKECKWVWVSALIDADFVPLICHNRLVLINIDYGPSKYIDMDQNGWHLLSTRSSEGSHAASPQNRHSFGVCVWRNQIVIVGGHHRYGHAYASGLRSCVVLRHLDDAFWDDRQITNTSRCYSTQTHVSVVSCDDHLIVLDQYMCERYDITLNMWVNVPIPKAISQCMLHQTPQLSATAFQ